MLLLSKGKQLLQIYSEVISPGFLGNEVNLTFLRT
jgi:hypothetical protein